ncbi:unnamed protein product [Rotaria sp. Silwood1]|nr:unnamed protein product [Rotaria sp. Silwood1]CAF4938919.1 unnamed protein product [Rotaria sp. Silwood1]
MCSIITGLEVFTVVKIFSPKVLFDEHILWQILRNGVRRISLTVNLPCNNSNRYLITESEIQLIGSDRAYRRYILQGFTLSSFERGSVLQCLLNKEFDKTNQDIDLFYIGTSKRGYKSRK